MDQHQKFSSSSLSPQEDYGHTGRPGSAGDAQRPPVAQQPVGMGSGVQNRFGRGGPDADHSSFPARTRAAATDGPLQDAFDPEYQQWRDEQMRALDDDYRTWRGQGYAKFSQEFSIWRDQKRSPKGSAAFGNDPLPPASDTTR